MSQQPVLFDMAALPARDETDHILALLAGDPKHASDRRRIIQAITTEAHASAGRIDINRVRARLTSGGQLTVHPPTVGATIAALRARGWLTPAGWGTNDDVRSGNRGKPLMRYVWHGAA